MFWQTYIYPFFHLLNEMAPYLLLGFLIAGLLNAFVPRSLYNRHLSGNNFRSVVLAALFGVPLPLCSCGVIPTAMSLRKNGASKGATVSFLISTPQTGVDSILATWSLMGAPMAIIRPIAAFVTALFGGALTNAFNGREESATEEDADKECCKGEKTFRQKFLQALRYGYVDMMQDIGKWLVIGLIIAGLITIFIPEGFFTSFNDRPLINMLMVLGFAIPMYLCATGSIPIAAALMLKGLSPGAALVLLMAGPATNMAAILVINKVLKRKTLIVYLLSIIGGAIGFGLIIDYLLPTEWFARGVAEASGNCSSGCQTRGTPVWKTLSSVVMAGLLINAFIQKHKHNNPQPKTLSLKVKGMRCNHCKANVEKNIAALPGVESVKVDLTEGMVYVEGTAEGSLITETIEKLGFEVIDDAAVSSGSASR